MSLDIYLGDYCDHCTRGSTLFQDNITHNLVPMAEEAGLYKFVWRPDENDIKTADQLREPLRLGLMTLKANPERFKPYNAKNGWGTYERFVVFIESYLRACNEYPQAIVKVSDNTIYCSRWECIPDKLLNRVRSGLEELKAYEARVSAKKQLDYEDGFRAGRMETELKNRCLEKLQYELKLVRLNKEEPGRYRGSIPFNGLTLDEIQKVKTLISEFTTGGVKS